MIQWESMCHVYTKNDTYCDKWKHINVFFLLIIVLVIIIMPPSVSRRAHVLFTLFVFVCVKWCPRHIVLCFCCVTKLPASLDYPFLIAPSALSKSYLIRFQSERLHIHSSKYKKKHASLLNNCIVEIMDPISTFLYISTISVLFVYLVINHIIWFNYNT